MPRPDISLREAGRQAQTTIKPWVENLARLGYAAKGSVYVIIGVLAAQTALGRGGATTDSQGALRALADQPFGAILLGLVGVGLAAYALWRFVEALVDPEGKGLAKRIAHVGVGLIYGSLAVSAIDLITGDGGQGVSEESWTARVLAQPFGRFVVGLVGAGVIAYFLYQIVKAFRGDFPESLNVGDLSGDEARWARRLGTFGLASRGVVFSLIGLFLMQAAIRHDAQRAGGLDQSLQAVAQQRYGMALLGVVALGLAAYGSYMLLISRYRRSFIY